MTDARPTSFPFLAIAKEFGVPYPVVIRAAAAVDAAIDNGNTHYNFFGLGPAIELAITFGILGIVQKAVKAERDRRAGLREGA